MNDEAVLTTAYDGLAALHRPIMVIALRGWFDVADVATGAIEELIHGRVAPVVASIDPDPFFDFTQERPLVVHPDGEEASIAWPTNQFRLARFPGADHDLVVLAGVEPHLRMRTFIGAIMDVVGALGCEAVVTLGAAADAVPHTRLPLVVSSTTSAQLASALGLARPQYQGITGLVGVLQAELEAGDIPGVSLRVGVPHYVSTAHPLATLALLRHLAHVVGVPVDESRINGEVAQWRQVQDDAVNDDPQASAYVAELERRYDAQIDRQLDNSGTIAAQFERFLRERAAGDDDGIDGPSDEDDDAGGSPAP